MIKQSQVVPNHQAEIINLIRKVAYKRDTFLVASDWLEMAAISVSNSVNPNHRQERESRYLDIIKLYDKAHQDIFPEIFNHLVEALEEKVQTTGAEDVLADIFLELSLNRQENAQFFTPQCVSEVISKLLGVDAFQAAIAKRGYMTALEPACGSGGTIIALCKLLQESNINYCTQLVITAVDIDPKCVYMTYLQLSLYGVPAVVIHGNSLTGEEWSRWYTPVYIVDGWIWREPCGIINKRSREDELIKCALEPTYAAMRQMEALFANVSPQAVPVPSKPEDKPLARLDPALTLPTEQLSLF
jgi:type I restriction-modification system DNA methylase subunit